MFLKGWIGNRHTHREKILKQIKDSRDTGKAYKELVKENFIIEHPTNYGQQVSLNSKRIKEIREILLNK